MLNQCRGSFIAGMAQTKPMAINTLPENRVSLTDELIGDPASRHGDEISAAGKQRVHGLRFRCRCRSQDWRRWWRPRETGPASCAAVQVKRSKNSPVMNSVRVHVDDQKAAVVVRRPRVVVVGSLIIFSPRIILVRLDGAESDSCVPAPARRGSYGGAFYSAGIRRGEIRFSRFGFFSLRRRRHRASSA
jgi:hypothetical protein